MAQFKGTRGPKRRPPIHRVLEKVVVDEDECWLVEGIVRRKGYTSMTIEQGVCLSSHKVSYEFFHGSVPVGYEVDHTCHNHDLSCAGGSTCKHRRCVNPKHLEAVPRQVNLSRGRGPRATAERHASITHCPSGHEYTSENAYFTNHPSGYSNRHCRKCQVESQRRYRARQRAGLI